MTIAAGTRFGPYEILAAIGAGGMGEVYKARDTRLDRTVAIKVLPAFLADDAQFRERFDREARAIARLDHPNICALYDVGEQDGTSYLVMQYLEGETLERRLTKGALPLDQALQCAIQVAEALYKAHRAGIVHRDLKPGNIMLTKMSARLLDFGLAKSSPVVASATPSMLPTTPPNLTAIGAILGTFQYMAPEQLQGKTADARSDIFSFGCVVYEMLTGTKAFVGSSQASLIGAILKDDAPSLVARLPTAPPMLDRLLRSCLAKDPDDRPQTAHDVALQLTWLADTAGVAATSSPPTTPQRRRSWVWPTTAVVSAVALLLIALAIGGRFGGDHPDRDPIFMSVLSGLGPAAAAVATLALAPDGRAIAYVAGSSAGGRSLWYRPLNAPDAHSLAGTDEAALPFFSPDGSSLGFFAGGKLKKIAVNGNGGVQTLASAPEACGGTWGANDAIVFCASRLGGLFVVNANGGQPQPIVAPDSGTPQLFGDPTFLPGGLHFLYVAASIGSGPLTPSLYVGSLDRVGPRKLIDVSSNVAYAAPGFLLYVQDGSTLVAQAFDVSTLRVTGDPIVIADNIAFSRSKFYGTFSASGADRIAYVIAPHQGVKSEWRDRSGRELPEKDLAEEFTEPALSPDGHRLAGQRLDPRTGLSDIWVRDLTRGVTSRLTFGPRNTSPVWSADGSRIAYASVSNGPVIEVRPASGGPATVLWTSPKGPGLPSPNSWTDDGRFISLRHDGLTTQADIWVLPLAGDRQAISFLQTEFVEWQAQLSPDGKWMAYTSNESGSWEVYVQPFPSTGAKWQISPNGGGDPQWRGDSKELFYLGSDLTLMAVPVRTEPAFEPAAPQPLFLTHVRGLVDNRNHYVVTRDGQQFMFTVPAGSTPSAPMTIVLNWTGLLQRR